jgi:hypothetical protein
MKASFLGQGIAQTPGAEEQRGRVRAVQDDQPLVKQG